MDLRQSALGRQLITRNCTERSKNVVKFTLGIIPTAQQTFLPLTAEEFNLLLLHFLTSISQTLRRLVAYKTASRGLLMGVRKPHQMLFPLIPLMLAVA